MDPIEQSMANAFNKRFTGSSLPRFPGMVHGPATITGVQSEVVSEGQQQSHPAVDGGESQETVDVHGEAAASGRAVKESETSVDAFSQKVVQLIESEGLNLPPSAVEVIMGALNPGFIKNPVVVRVALRF